MINTRRYPGSRPFLDNDLERMLFRGRDQEKSDLLNLILAHDQVLLYARSGTGKTSLLNAGVLQALRSHEMFPIILRFYPDDAIASMHKGVMEEAHRKKIEVERANNTSEDMVLLLGKGRFWSQDTLLTPVLIFDQFEELFTLHEQSLRQQIIKVLSDLVARRLPRELEEEFESFSTIPYKVVFSVREDFLGEIENVADLIPTVYQHRFRLTPLNRYQAEEAIREPALLQNEELESRTFTYSDDAIEMLVSFLTRKRSRGGFITSEEVEPFQLQIICQSIEKKALELLQDPQPIVITREFFGSEEGMDRILEEFYNDQIVSLPEEARDAVHHLCEYGLINAAGKRVSLEEESITTDYQIERTTLKILVDQRLLRAEPRLDSTYYELSHDTLVSAVLRTRALRRPKLLLAAARRAMNEKEQMSAARSYLELARHFVGISDQNDISWADFDEAIDYLVNEGFYIDIEDVVELIQDSGVVSPHLQVALARVWIAKGEFNKAVDHLRKVVKAYPGFSWAHFWLALGNLNLAQAENSSEAREQAVESIREAIVLDDSQPLFHQYRLITFAVLSDVEGFNKYLDNYAENEALLQVLPATISSMNDIMTGETAVAILQSVLRAVSGSFDVVAAVAQVALDIEEYATADKALEAVIQLNPDADVYSLWGAILHGLEDYKGAEEKLTIAADMHPEDGSIWFDRAEVRYIQDYYDDAIEDCQKAIELGYEPWEARLMWGRCLYFQDLYKEACQQLSLADELKPKNSEILSLWADTLVMLEQWKQAIEKARLAIQADPENPDAYRALAISLRFTGRPHEADDRFKTAHELDRDDFTILLDWGRLLSVMKRHEDAIDKFERANRLKEDDPQILVEWGMALTEAKKNMLALEKCQKALLLDESSGEAHLCKARNLYAIGHKDEAYEEFERAGQLSPQDPYVHLEWASTLSSSGRQDESDSHYRQALELADDKDKLADVYDNWGYSLGRNKLHCRAEEIYRKALEVKEDAFVLTRLAEELVDQNKLDEAKKHLRRAEQLLSDEESELGEFGWIYYRLGEFDKSLHYSQRALEMDPSALYARCNSGLALLMLGRPEEAKTAYEKAIRYTEKNMDADDFEYHAVDDLEDLMAKHGDITGGAELLSFVRENLQRIRQIRAASVD
ncbi:MAG: tetratricopeptide repeat protein [Candidatus Thiodiazotropha sp.]